MYTYLPLFIGQDSAFPDSCGLGPATPPHIIIIIGGDSVVGLGQTNRAVAVGKQWWHFLFPLPTYLPQFTSTYPTTVSFIVILECLITYA